MSQKTVLKGLLVTRTRGEMTAVLPVFASLSEATANGLHPGDLYQDPNEFVRIVPGEVDATAGEEYAGS